MFALRSLLSLLLVLACASAEAAEHAIVDVRCFYPKGEAATTAEAAASFESNSRRENVNVLYVRNSTDLERELRRRSGVKFTQVSPGHFVSSGRIYTVRSVEDRPSRISFACYESIALLVAKLTRTEPAEVSGLPSPELFLLDGVGKGGWTLIQKQTADRSTDAVVSTIETYYFRRSE